MKNLNLGKVLTKSEQRSVSGGCVAQHCESAFWAGKPSCLTSTSHFMMTGEMYNQTCLNNLNSAYFNCWDDYCNAQPY